MANSKIKHLDKKMDKTIVLIRILELIKRKEMSIAQLQRETNMKRSTLVHYIGILEAQGVISRERIEKEKTGRPTILKFNKSVWVRRQKELEKRFEEEHNELYLEMANNPLTKRVLEIIKDNPEIDMNDLLSHNNIKDYVRKFEFVSWLHQNKLIKEAFTITSEGEKFLKENKS